MRIDRRTLVSGIFALPLAAPSIARAAPARVVIVGGGIGGVSTARAIKRHASSVSVTLIERNSQYHTCPFSNGVLGGLWPLERIRFSYEKLSAAGIDVIHETAAALDPQTRRVTLSDGRRLEADFLVLSPGIQFVWTAIEGLSETVSRVMPHGWQAGEQTTLLRDQLVAMRDGGTVVVAIPRPPFRCPPGPYERISLIAHYLKTAKPASKIIVLDAQQSFSKQDLFEEAWNTLYPGMIERLPGSASGEVLSVDPGRMRVSTGFDDFAVDVANIIPPQRAGQIALAAGLDQGLGWCPVDPVSFESKAAPGIFILGDAAVAGDMPKSAFAANVQAKTCADAILARIEGQALQPAKLINVCYSLAAPGYGFSIADVFEPRPDKLTSVITARKTTALKAPKETLALEAEYAAAWFDTVTAELFG